MTILRANTRRIDLDADVDLAKLAAATPGMLGGDLRRMVTDALARAHRRGQGVVQREDFRVALSQMAIDTKGPLILSEARRWRMAYHEAGHALVGMLQPGADVVRTASILPSAQVVEAAPGSLSPPGDCAAKAIAAGGSSGCLADTPPSTSSTSIKPRG